MNQKTVKNNVNFTGVGVHSGTSSVVTIKPAQADAGIIFCEKGSPNNSIKIGEVIPEIAMHATVLKSESWFVSTIEHLMAALYILGIDNAVVEVAGYEVPILDGSALPFFQSIREVGVADLGVAKKFLTPKSTLSFEDNKGRSIIIDPFSSATSSDHMEIDYSADFSHPLVGGAQLSGVITHEFFTREIAPARTFGFLEQLPFVRKHGLAQGTSLGNTVVVGHEDLINDLRFPNECLRHKVLDLIGDLYLLGKPLVGKIKASKTGHSFNRLVVDHFVNNPDVWTLV